MSRSRLIPPLILAAALNGCATVPPQAIQLSEVVSARTGDMRASHEAFVSAYFQLTRDRINDYVSNRFTPQFMANFVRESQLLELLTDASTSDAERGQITVEFAQAAVFEIDKHRNELLAPLRQQEIAALNAIRSAYAELQEMNASLRALLQSVSDVQAEQDAVLERLNLLRKRDQAIDEAVSLNQQVTAAIDKGEAIETTIDALKCILDENCQE